jgi:hypothetical protein
VSCLPCEREAEKRRNGAAMSQGKMVLVIEDDAEIREIIATVLEDGGYQIDSASNGAEAFRMAQEHEPDAVILDVTMPAMGGHSSRSGAPDPLTAVRQSWSFHPRATDKPPSTVARRRTCPSRSTWTCWRRR